jgi:hypothetical protein
MFPLPTLILPLSPVQRGYDQLANAAMPTLFYFNAVARTVETSRDPHNVADAEIYQC